MKKIKIIISTLLSVMLLNSCSKTVVNGTFTIKGHLYTDCSKKPVVNKALILEDYWNDGYYKHYTDLSKCTTDSNGYFEFTYSNPPNGNVYIQTVAGAGFEIGRAHV